MIHEDFRSNLKEGLYNSLTLIAAKPLLHTSAHLFFTPTTPKLLVTVLLILESIKLGEMALKEIDKRKLYLFTYLFILIYCCYLMWV